MKQWQIRRKFRNITLKYRPSETSTRPGAWKVEVPGHTTVGTDLPRLAARYLRLDLRDHCIHEGRTIQVGKVTLQHCRKCRFWVVLVPAYGDKDHRAVFYGRSWQRALQRTRRYTGRRARYGGHTFRIDGVEALKKDVWSIQAGVFTEIVVSHRPPGPRTIRRLVTPEILRALPVPARDTDGKLIGWKLLSVRGGVLRSPVWGTEWPAPAAILQAAGFEEAGRVRFQGGIHACWPDSMGAPSPYTDLQSGRTHSIFPESSHVLAEVRGWGRYVAGDQGWRAEYAQVVRVIAENSQVAQEIKRMYPELEVEVRKT